MLDLAIIGSGPAALTAGIYAARSGLAVKIFEKSRFGGALPDISHIANFPGFDGPGQKLADNMKKQAEQAGVDFAYGEVTDIQEGFLLLVDGEEISSRAVLVATGSEPIPLDFETTKPISYCASCDGPLYKDKEIVVVGGGNSAVQESIYLAKIVKKLTLVNHSELRAQKCLIDQLSKIDNVEIKTNLEPTRELLDQFDGIFVFIGHRPATSFLPREILDSHGYIVTDAKQMTKIPGIFAAGDVRDNTVKQAITAAGDGASAATAIAKYLSDLQK